MNFWEIIKEAKFHSSDKTYINDALANILSNLTTSEVHDFGSELSTKVNELYSEDILRIGSLLKGPLTDDGFHYFRLYLILQGKEIYRLALTRPEEAGLRMQKFYVFSFLKYELSEFTHIPAKVYKTKTGEDI